VFHVKHEGWPSDLPTEVLALLDRYAGLLEDYAIPRGMISAADVAGLRSRHVGDSLRGRELLMGISTALDMGSGAGLPGVPLAIAAPDVQVVLAESRRTRVAFLELVLEELGIANATVHAGRVEDLETTFDVALARGFGDASSTWDVARQVLNPAGRLLYWAGSSFDPSRDGPPGVRLELYERPALERQGPVVIMARQ
jgi:16S rRNA (guanine527-N7)-methyltransferase